LGYSTGRCGAQESNAAVRTIGTKNLILAIIIRKSSINGTGSRSNMAAERCNETIIIHDLSKVEPIKEAQKFSKVRELQYFYFN